MLRNFLHTIKHFKLATALNILGLGVALSSLIVIIMQVDYELSFDKSYPNAGRVYRVEHSWDFINFSPMMSRPQAELYTNDIAQIESYVLEQTYPYNTYFTLNLDQKQVGFKEEFMSFSGNFTDVFGLELIQGTKGAVEQADDLLVPLSIARKLFGENENYLGRSLMLGNSAWNVGAVYRDFPANSSQRNVIYYDMWGENQGQWQNSNYYTYVVLGDKADRQSVERTINGKLSSVPNTNHRAAYVRLTPIEEVYFLSNTHADASPKGNRATTILLISIAMLIMVVAGINFVNFATALTPLRIKSINTQKILGSSNAYLRVALIVESLCITAIAFVLALGLVDLLGKTGFSEFLIAPISLAGNGSVLWFSGCVACVTGVLAGLYPAFYSTAFSPVMVLNGSFGMSKSGRRLRQALIGFQFFISIALIIATLFLQLQNNYMRSYDKGIATDQVAIVGLSDMMSRSDKKPLVTNLLKSSPTILDVAYAQFEIGASDEYMGWGRDFRDDITLQMDCLPVSYNFCSVMGLKITDGRDFNEKDALYTGGRAIFNEKARAEYGLTLDDTFNGHSNDTVAQIVGFVEDFNYKSLRYPISAAVLYEYGDRGWSTLPVAYIKIAGNPYAAADHIKRVLNQVDPAYPVDVKFYDTVFDNLYQKERKMTAQITLFSLLAIIISLIGVFGVVVFETQFRRREIGLRKINGATVGVVLGMFNRRFIILVCASFVVAAPVAWWAVSKWLEGFAYRTPLYWWVFAAGLAIVLFLTVVTVTVQSYRAAIQNPVKSLKSE